MLSYAILMGVIIVGSFMLGVIATLLFLTTKFLGGKDE